MKQPPFYAKNILFDLDGTLVDTAPDLHRATNHVLKSLGRSSVPLDEVRHSVGHGAKALMTLGLTATGGMEDHDLDLLLPSFLDYYAANLTVESKIYDGATEMLDTLREAGIVLGVCTNKPASLAVRLLDNLSLSGYFRAVTGGDTFAFRKPDPRHLTATLSLMGEMGPTLMVGDSINDIEAAKAANMPAVAVSFGYTDIAPHALGADLVIDNLVELIHVVTPETD